MRVSPMVRYESAATCRTSVETTKNQHYELNVTEVFHAQEVPAKEAARILACQWEPYRTE
jgi:hypothetical protein